MKRVIPFLAAAALLLSACGAGTKVIDGEVNSQTITNTSQESSKSGDTDVANSDEYGGYEGFVLTYNGVDIHPGETTEEALAALGEPDSSFEAASCAFEGMTYYYSYTGFEFDTYKVDDVDCVCTIVITSDLVSTPEGITIGDDLNKLDKVYGEDFEVNGMTRVYRKGSSKLVVIHDGAMVTSIEYYPIDVG